MTFTSNLVKDVVINKQTRKLPPKVFKEIEDEYDLEIIPAASNPLSPKFGPSMEIDSLMEAEDDSFNDPSTAKRRGRPPGSKNKAAVPKQGDNSNRFVALMEQECTAESPPNVVSQ